MNLKELEALGAHCAAGTVTANGVELGRFHNGELVLYAAGEEFMEKARKVEEPQQLQDPTPAPAPAPRRKKAAVEPTPAPAPEPTDDETAEALDRLLAP